MNPAELAQKRRALELSKLKEENEKLKERLKMLEESGGLVDDLTVKVEQKMLQPSSSKQVTGSCALLMVMLKLNIFIISINWKTALLIFSPELQAKLEQAELKNLRLTEVFKKTSRDIREVCCYQLLGYKFDIPGSNQYRLMSMYAESPNDYLLFQVRNNTNNGSFTLPDLDKDSDLDSKPIGYIVLCRTFRTWIPTPYLCIRIGV